MRIVLLGANGFIGSAILARLAGAGHDVVALARQPGNEQARVTWRRIDLRRMTSPEDWRSMLDGVDAVVNSAGTMQDGPDNSTRSVHVDSADALYAACEAAGVRRVVLISAIGVDRAAVTAFSETKRAGESALMRRGVDWVILRPSLVLGASAYGGSALLRGLAALPVHLQFSESGAFGVVSLSDVVATVEEYLRPEAPSRVALDVTGVESYTFSAIVRRYRHWLRLPPAPTVRVPAWLTTLAAKGGDGLARLGWKPPLRTNARHELLRGATGDPRPWIDARGSSPASLDEILSAAPASVQERWFARMYFVKPILLATLALFWIATGLITPGPASDSSLGYLERAGITEYAGLVVIAGALLDILIGLGIAVRRSARAALVGSLLASLAYVVVGTLVLPGLWLDALGPLMKVGPIMVASLAALAVLPDR